MIPTFTPLRLSRTGLTGTTAIPVCRNRRVYGAIIIDAREPEPFAYDREHVVMLSDWTDENPHSLLKKLKKQSDYYNFNKPTVGSFSAT
jgi:FtsP/CotA-like multicopper oxidase with cupredoxin domain